MCIRDRSLLFSIAGSYYSIKGLRNYIPDELMLLEAFNYWQESYRMDNGASSLKVYGTPSLLSTRRGIGSWIMNKWNNMR